MLVSRGQEPVDWSWAWEMVGGKWEMLRWHPHAAHVSERGSVGLEEEEGMNSPHPSSAWPPMLAAWFLRHSLSMYVSLCKRLNRVVGKEKEEKESKAKTLEGGLNVVGMGIEMPKAIEKGPKISNNDSR
ncbi:unnamed protein product [Sphenostylis stenocarpa]|uniref:Uncharacterized protein n=1 Tax=Sphenostylis stenocarpa TaxID=92480 RepID=A0AA86V4U5_9FABA|nr:unnamed protein product [Sphenostylis stenocarpa]